MKHTAIAALIALVLAPAALAHPGHDHTYTPGGEQHHLLWLAASFVATFAAVWAYRRYRSGR